MALTRIADVFDRQQRNLNEVQLAFAGPQSTSRLVTGLPLVALALAQLVGMNPAAAITGSALGLVSVALGVGLLALGQQWSKRLLSKAVPQTIDPGAFIDCVLIGLQAGLPLQVAREKAQVRYQETFLEASSQQDELALDEAAELSRKSGAALSEILLANADRFRDELRYEISGRIARLGIKLMIPLGVAVLPAFILISIVPIAISLLSNGQP
jgi:tight adherence protein B